MSILGLRKAVHNDSEMHRAWEFTKKAIAYTLILFVLIALWRINH